MTITASLGSTVDHLAKALTGRSEGLCFEVHSEFMVEDGPRIAALQALAERYPIARTVPDSRWFQGSPPPPRVGAVEMLSVHVMAIPISDHFGWQKRGGVQYADDLPFSRPLETLKAAADNIIRAKDEFGRRFMVKNPATYVDLPEHAFEEAEFLVELCVRTNYDRLVDVTSIRLSAKSLGTSTDAYIDRRPAKLIAAIHLGGTSTDPDPICPMLVDSHNVPIPQVVWRLFLRLIDRVGPRPTPVYCARDGVPFEALLAERDTARGMLVKAERVHA